MAEMIGRKAALTIDGAAVATGRTKTLTINNEVIDITGDSDDGIQRMLTVAGQKSVEFSYEGLFDSADTTLLDLSLASDDISAALVLTVDGLFTITGTFVMPSFSLGAPYNEATTFSATFNSTGAVVKAVV